jgi:hypothetical protein
VIDGLGGSQVVLLEAGLTDVTVFVASDVRHVAHVAS